MEETKKLLGKKGQVIHSQGREMIHNVAKFMKQETAANAPIIPLSHTRERVLAVTGISKSTYTRVIRESRNIEAGEGTSFSTPHKQRVRKSPKSDLPAHEMEEVRRIVNNFYIMEKRRPTLKGILLKLEECNVPFEGGMSPLSVLLRKLGFR